MSELSVLSKSKKANSNYKKYLKDKKDIDFRKIGEIENNAIYYVKSNDEIEKIIMVVPNFIGSKEVNYIPLYMSANYYDTFFKRKMLNLVSYRMKNSNEYASIDNWSVTFMDLGENENSYTTLCSKNFLKDLSINMQYINLSRNHMEDILCSKLSLKDVKDYFQKKLFNVIDPNTIEILCIGDNVGPILPDLLALERRRAIKQVKEIKNLKKTLFSDFIIGGLGAGGFTSLLTIISLFIILGNFDIVSFSIGSICFIIALIFLGIRLRRTTIPLRYYFL